MSSPDLDLSGNIAAWTQANAEHTDGAAERQWSADEMTWGVFGVPESTVGCIGDVAGLEVVELGCGTAYVSAWLVRRGARPVGIDNSPKQLETAERLQREHGLEFPLLLGNAEQVPYPDASFVLWFHSGEEPVTVQLPDNDWVHAGEVVLSTDPKLAVGTPVKMGERLTLSPRAVAVLRES